MRPGAKVPLNLAGAITVLIILDVNIYARNMAIDAVTPNQDPIFLETPADRGLEYEDILVVSEDDHTLFGWYVPSENGPVMMAAHGMGGSRQDLLFEAEFLNRHGYGVLLLSFRAHDFSEGKTISFRYHERRDMDAWYNYLASRDDVDVDRVGILGESTGAATSILYLS